MKQIIAIALVILVGSILISGCGGGGSESANPLVGSITGVVKDTGGATISGVTVTTNGGRTTTTNTAGAFEFTNLVPGTYTLTASKTGYVTASGSVEVAGGANSTFTFTIGATAAGTGRLDGLVYDNAAAVLSGVAVSTSGGRTTFSDAEGKFAFKDLPGGHYTLTASKVGYVTATDTVTVLPGASKAFTFVLSPL